MRLKIKIHPIIERYLISEFLLSFLVCFIFYVIVFLLNQILLMAQAILSKGIPIGSVMLLILYAMPSFITLSAPFAALTSGLMCYGRFSSDNEILAMRSAGFKRFQIFRPVLLMGILIALLSLGVNDILLPAGTRAFQRLWLELSLTNPGLELEEFSVRNFDSVYVIPGQIDKTGIHPMILIDRDSSGNRSIIISKLATAIKKSRDNDFPGFRLYDVFSLIPDSQNLNEWTWIRADHMDFRIISGDNTIINQQAGPSNMRILEVAAVIGEKRTEYNKEMNLYKKDIREDIYYLTQVYASIAEAIQSADLRNKLQQRFSEYTNRLLSPPLDYSLQIWTLEFYQKFAIPLSSIPFIILGFPLGSLAKRSGRAVGFFMGLLLSSIYWSILVIGRNWGLRGQISPFAAMVLPNILLFVLGILIYRNRTHA